MAWLANKLGLTETQILATFIATMVGLALVVVGCKAIGFYYMLHN